MTESIMLKKSKAFALRIVRLYKYLCEHKESVIAKQMLRSGTAIGANIAESRYAQSKADFASKLQIALKEASETEYRLELLRDAELVNQVLPLIRFAMIAPNSSRCSLPASRRQKRNNYDSRPKCASKRQSSAV